MKQVKKDEKMYPWTPTDAELSSIASDAEVNYRQGKYIEKEEMNQFFDSLK